ncbi:MAG: fluoride efflux transporter CrcB [Alphaproteobacteria bacterium]|nr:fluoride efflux transporter CrcB [Rhodospirillales bacterium]MCW9045949.1 fluoride efflux transporter CrcB [Alphaproteobacteria bacterium]
MSGNMLLYVAAGGALGAVGRFLLMSQIGQMIGHGFPYGTLVVNIVGSFALGAFLETSTLIWSPSPEIRAMVVIGMLGAFTTFSAFSFDAFTLMDRGDIGAAWLYIVVSVFLSIGAFFAAISLFRYLFP